MYWQNICTNKFIGSELFTALASPIIIRNDAADIEEPPLPPLLLPAPEKFPGDGTQCPTTAFTAINLLRPSCNCASKSMPFIACDVCEAASLSMGTSMP